jgi:hypothetical protein
MARAAATDGPDEPDKPDMEGDDDMQLNFDDPLAMLQRQIERRIARPKVPLTKVSVPRT